MAATSIEEMTTYEQERMRRMGDVAVMTLPELSYPEGTEPVEDQKEASDGD